jgi:hypothetical protein
VQASFFGLVDQDAEFLSLDTGNPVIARPFFDVTTGTQDSELVSYPGILTGAVGVEALTRLYGAEALWRHRVIGHPAVRVDVLAGYRYGQLFDRLGIEQGMISLDASSGYVEDAFIGRSDLFESRNEFHGAELGMISRLARGRWAVELSGKVALGGIWTSAYVDGGTTIVTEVGDRTITRNFDGGLLALPTNMGRYQGGEFSILSELGLSLHYRLTYYTRITIGYDVLAWTEVGRATNQIDFGINPSQVPPGTLVGQARPRFAMNRDDFWARGLHFGLECQF